MPKRQRAVEYLVTWGWRDSEDRSYRDVVQATNAERAIGKVRKLLAEEYSFKKSDVVIVEVVLYG